MRTMMQTASRFFASAVAAFALTAAAGGAQTPAPADAPTASPAATPALVPIAAFSAHAHMGVTVTTNGNTFSGTAQIGVAQSGAVSRLDFTKLSSQTLPIPPGVAFSVVIDRTRNTITAINDATKRYHTQSLIPIIVQTPKPGATATPKPAPFKPSLSPLATLTLFTMTIALTGHMTTLGERTTGMSFDLQAQRVEDKAPMHITASTQIAERLASFPMSLDATIEPGAAPFDAKMSYAVDTFTEGPQPASLFRVPAGYTDARSLPSVIFRGAGG